MFNGNGEFCLYEDNTCSEEDIKKAFTNFTCSFRENKDSCELNVEINSQGNREVIPDKRAIKVLFRNIKKGEISILADNEKIEYELMANDCLAVKFAYDSKKNYSIKVAFEKQTEKSRILDNVTKLIMTLEDDNCEKVRLYDKILKVNTMEEYIAVVEESKLKKSNKNVLKEFI